MKVLLIHNRYKVSGGEDVSSELEIKQLRENNVSVETLILDNNVHFKTGLKTAINAIWSSHYYKLVYDKIKNGSFDLVHVQNFFPLFSPSIFYACHKAKVKVVMSVRNYRLLCPNALMYVNGNICTDCLNKKVPWPAIKKKCYRDSSAATTAVASMLTFHNFRDTWQKKIDAFICVSEFVKMQFINAGFDPDKLKVKYNSVDSSLEPNFSPRNYYVYIGRLSIEKGLDCLLDSFIKSGKEIVIIGDGPLQEMIINASLSNSNIKYHGKKDLLETYTVISNALALIQPSKCHETFGRTIIEAYAHGTPVIAARLGGMTELVQEGINGFLFNPYVASDLNIILEQFESSGKIVEMRYNAYRTYIENFCSHNNGQKLIEIYNSVLEQ